VVWLPTADEMAALDRRAVESGATTERTLIEAAGREVARRVHGRWPRGPVVGLLGSGHNGADALVALRTLAAWGREVRGVICGSGPPEPDVRAGWDVPLVERDRLDGVLEGAGAVLDGILGTGVTGAPREPQAAVIRRADAAPVPVVAVDGPSGVDFTTGAVPGDCARARLTVSLGWPKLGLLRHPARTYCGELEAVEIGFPPVEGTEMGARAVTARWVRRMLRSREADAHKGEAGYLAVVAGQEGMAGASVLAARAAGRGGAGIVRVVGSPGNRSVVQSSVPDAVFTGWSDPDAVEEAVEWSHAVVAGPGLGRGPDRRGLVERVLEARGDRPVLLDADALNVWEGALGALADHLDARDLVTPHPGELGRLLELPVADVVADPPARAREAAHRLGATVLLKGAPSLVAEPDGRLRVASTAGPAVASGGSGDVLSGLAGAYLAAGLGPADAASAALLISGAAARQSPVPEGHLASDVPDRIPAVRRRLEELPAVGEGPVLFALPAAG
jgi:NAD(P)H-hydrate epimerase